MCFVFVFVYKHLSRRAKRQKRHTQLRHTSAGPGHRTRTSRENKCFVSRNNSNKERKLCLLLENAPPFHPPFTLFLFLYRSCCCFRNLIFSLRGWGTRGRGGGGEWQRCGRGPLIKPRVLTLSFGSFFFSLKFLVPGPSSCSAVCLCVYVFQPQRAPMWSPRA